MNQEPILYILMRTDIDSLNPGKMAAQACHAANACVDLCHADYGPLDLYDIWSQSTDQAFGTTIVLNGGTIEEIKTIVNKIGFSKDRCSDIIHDPTYPIRDGQIIHLVPLDTCAYVFGDKNNKKIQKELANLELYR